MSKYKLLKEDFIEHEGKILFRIEAEKDFGSVKKGEKGGYIEFYRNLSQSGKAWVKSGKVLRCAKVGGHAWVNGDVIIEGGRISGGKILGSTRVLGGRIGGGTLRGGVIHDGWINDGIITGGQIHEGTVMNGGQISGGQVYNSKIYYGFIRGGIVRNSHIIGGNIIGGQVGNCMVSGGIISGGYLKDCAVYGGKVNSGIFKFSPLFIQGSKDYFCVSGCDEITIGCNTHSFDKWSKHFRMIGFKNGYTEDQIEEYGRYIEMAINSKNQPETEVTLITEKNY